MASNKAAWLDAQGASLQVRDAPMPKPGPSEIVIQNRAVAINPLDWHMQDIGIFVQQWPTILGCDVAGEVFEVGSDVTRFTKGDRVIAHTIGAVTAKPQDAAFALYSVAPAAKAAILPAPISYADGSVLPLALETAICGLALQTPGEALPGVPTPTMGLPYPRLSPIPCGKTIIVHGGSSSVGTMTIQLAVASGVTVIALAGSQNLELCRSLGATEAFDYKDPLVLQKVVDVIADKKTFAGIVDAVSTPSTYEQDLQLLSQIGNGGYLVCSHPPPTEGLPENVKAGMIFSINDISQQMWEEFVTPALQSGQLKCAPRTLVVGKGLEYIQEALQSNKAGRD
ncbi:hypothetical protein TruAng_007225 [Truncatella angustata]|nr:hypothetical protein TruAng_007225 [Truncatella angustata]